MDKGSNVWIVTSWVRVYGSLNGEFFEDNNWRLVIVSVSGRYFSEVLRDLGSYLMVLVFQLWGFLAVSDAIYSTFP